MSSECAARSSPSTELRPALARYHRKDHFHARAKREGFRSRAAYKLLEIDEAHQLLGRGKRVIDLGCWPGGWLQVAGRAVGPGGRVVGIDLAATEPTFEEANVTVVLGDLEAASTPGVLLEALGGRADCLLSDAAPKLTGIRATDRANEERLLEAVEALVPQLLAVGGDLLIKILEGPEAQAVDRRLRARFEKSRTVKPASTRKGSSERYLLALGYRGAADGVGSQ